VEFDGMKEFRAECICGAILRPRAALNCMGQVDLAAPTWCPQCGGVLNWRVYRMVNGSFCVVLTEVSQPRNTNHES